MLATCPSIFAETPWAGDATHKGMSGKYDFIPTIQVIDKMRSEGLMPVKAMQAKTRIEGKGDYTRHIIRFRSDRLAWNVSDSVPEIVLVNSHDGSSSYNLSAGIFRMVCANGMIIQSHDFGSYSTRHQGNVIDNVLDATYRILEDVPKLEDRVSTYQALTLTQDQQRAYVERAIGLRWDKDSDGHYPCDPGQLLRVRRSADNGDSLWLSYQRVQENLIKGGIRPLSHRGRRTRKVISPLSDYKLNRDLWALTEEIATSPCFV
jgi:hypothetical protein